MNVQKLLFGEVTQIESHQVKDQTQALYSSNTSCIIQHLSKTQIQANSLLIKIIILITILIIDFSSLLLL